MNKSDIGVIGLAVMGKNLALNIESRGYRVSVYNRSEDKTKELVDESNGKNILPTWTVEEFVNSLSSPRKMILMVKAGEAVDSTIKQLTPYLSKGDIIIDGGNSYFSDTIRRSKELAEVGLEFIGSGISGGEEGALKGPSIMPGGKKEAYEKIEKIFVDISAKVSGDACCTYIGENGAGHYVKMVHNGIEYGDMQLISEAYHILKGFGGFNNKELEQTFTNWNKGELDSYLIEITADIFAKEDPKTGKPMVDVILDKAGQKGTGKWTSQSALDLGVSVPVIAESVFARCISAIKDERVKASLEIEPEAFSFDDIKDSIFNIVKKEGDNDKQNKEAEKIQGLEHLSDEKLELAELVRRALYTSKICSYAQGFALLKAAAEEYGWKLDYGNIAMIFRGGCIIRAQFLNKIKEAYERNPELPNLLLDVYFKDVFKNYTKDWRKVIAIASLAGIPVPSFSAALAYFDSYRSENLPANLLQAQRDYFGAHTFERNDESGIFHHKWF